MEVRADSGKFYEVEADALVDPQAQKTPQGNVITTNNDAEARALLTRAVRRRSPWW